VREARLAFSLLLWRIADQKTDIARAHFSAAGKASPRGGASEPSNGNRRNVGRGTYRAVTRSVQATSNTNVGLGPLDLSAPGRILRAAGRHGARRLARALLPESVVVWQGRAARTAAGARHKRSVALTFDDGPNELTRAYLEVLERFGAHATFFVVGRLCADHPELVSAIAAGGHELSAHGYTHRRFPSLSTRELRKELTRTALLLPGSPGRRPLVRPPHGAVSLSSIFTCANAGFTTVLWSHDSGDSCTTSADDVCAAFEDERAPAPGAIVLFHEGQSWTLHALPRVLGKLSEAGHDFVTAGDLLGDR
jgi:peptidoglycan/xylan/chitin deacetylase (PgdA/CDA1 family)